MPTTRLTLRIGSVGRHLLAALERRLAQLQQRRDVERLVQAVILRDLADNGPRCRPRPADRRSLREIEAARLPMLDGLRSAPAGRLRPTISSMVRKPSWAINLAHFLGDEAHEVDDVLGLAGELLAQLRVLRGHADRAGVQMADAHHDAAQRHQRRGGEAELLGAEQRGDDHVAAGLQLAVGLDDDAAAQIVEHQRLVRLGQAQLPRERRRA